MLQSQRPDATVLQAVLAEAGGVQSKHKQVAVTNFVMYVLFVVQKGRKIMKNCKGQSTVALLCLEHLSSECLSGGPLGPNASESSTSP